MGNTTEEPAEFAIWLRDTLKSRNLRVMDLAREIARREGINEKDKEDFARRSRSIHGHVSNIINGYKFVGADYAVKIADALELPRESVLQIAGFLPDGGEAVIVIPASTRGRIDALLASLDEEQQEEAMRFLESYVVTQFREMLTPKPAPKRKMKKA